MKKNDKKQCDCNICVQYREFKKYLDQIENPVVKNWFDDYFSHFLEVEEELSCYKIYSQNLKELYPKIWKEVTTVETLKRDDAKYPEKQI